MYWDINKSLSYNKLFNFIIGNRGGGKTYGSKKWAINRFIKTGEQFIYLRRFQTEIKQVQTNFFSSISQEFPEYELSNYKGGLFLDKKPMGYIMALTKSADTKSLDFPLVSTIIFDEFLIEKGVHHYLSNEVRVFLNFYETIARMRDVRVLFLANAISVINPYFSYFNINLPFGSKFNSGEEWLIEMVADQDFIKEKKKTRFASLIKDTEYEKYSIENVFTNDVTSFVEKKTGHCRYLFTLLWNGKKYGVWINDETITCYMDEDIEENCKYKLCFKLEDYGPDYRIINNVKNDVLFSFVMMHYNRGSLRFNSIKTKEAFVGMANIR